MRLRDEDIHDFYEACYAPASHGEQSRRWRELGAVTKADHVVELIDGAGLHGVDVILEVGCGDGAVLAELARRGLGRSRIGLDISSSGVRIASGRAEIAEARVFDGRNIDAADGEYDLAIATHVLEHAPQPEMLLREVLRVARAAVIEVPLERNLSARRPTARAASEAAGHLHRFTSAEMQAMIRGAGWRVVGEVYDPLPPAVHVFGRDTVVGKAKGYAKWGIRTSLAALPSLGRRMITLHYAALAVPGKPGDPVVAGVDRPDRG